MRSYYSCRYGLPAYDRTGLTTLVVAILLVGYDLQWWEATLRQAAGLPTLVPEVLFNGVLDRLIIPKPAAPTHFLRYLQPAYLDVSDCTFIAAGLSLILICGS